MADLKEQLELIYKWLQGTFDNNCQYQLETEIQKREGKEPRYDWVWAKFFPANVPKFGDHVLFVRQGHRATSQVYRQRVYKFQISNEESCVMNQIYTLKDESWFEKAEKDPSSVADLDPIGDAKCLDGCGVYWKFLPEKNRFHGTTKEGTCRFESRFFPGKTIIASSDIYLDSSELWTHDKGVDTDGNKMYGFQSDEHHKFLHREIYKGSANHEGSVQELEVTIHNQGEEVKLDNTDYVVKLEQVIKVETREKALRLSVHAKGQEEAIGESIGDWNAAMIDGEFGSVKIKLEKK